MGKVWCPVQRRGYSREPRRVDQLRGSVHPHLQTDRPEKQVSSHAHSTGLAHYLGGQPMAILKASAMSQILAPERVRNLLLVSRREVFRTTEISSARILDGSCNPVSPGESRI